MLLLQCMSLQSSPWESESPRMTGLEVAFRNPPDCTEGIYDWIRKSFQWDNRRLPNTWNLPYITVLFLVTLHHASFMAEITVHRVNWVNVYILFSYRSWVFNFGGFPKSIQAGGSQVTRKDSARGFQVRPPNPHMHPPLDVPFPLTSFQFYGKRQHNLFMPISSRMKIFISQYMIMTLERNYL